MYSEQLLARFLNPEHTGDLDGADGLGVEGNITCGDVVHLAVKISDGLITEARFRAQGCATAIAAADACCEIVRGWTVTAAQTLDLAEVTALVGGIPEGRESCAGIGLGALRSALDKVRAAEVPAH